MEQFAGVPLLERGIHGARLTADGELFHESARRFDAQRFDLERIAGDLRARHAFLLRVGITGASRENQALPVLSDLVRRRPGRRLRLVIGKSDALESAVEQGELDLALVSPMPARRCGPRRATGVCPTPCRASVRTSRSTPPRAR